MSRLFHLVLTIAVLAVFAGLAYLLVFLKKPPETGEPTKVIPNVRVVSVQAADIPVVITANGTARARTSTQLTTQVSGQIVEVSPQFQEGGFFREGDLLVQLDPIRYETQLASTKAQLATANLALEREQALAARNAREWKSLEKGKAKGLAANVPQLAKARADVLAAEAAITAAEHDLEHTRIVAPYTGRVRAKMADVGQSVSALGAVLAEIYAIDFAEVFLPVPSEDAWFLELPGLEESEADRKRVTVELTAKLGGDKMATWHGYIDRSTGLIDPQSRFINVIVRVEDPYRLQSKDEVPPLQIGQFVRATIPGRVLPNAFEVPRDALLHEDRLLVVKDNLLQTRRVTIGRKESDRVIVTEGLQSGELVSLTRLSYYADGMEVKPISNPDEAPTGQLIQQVQNP